MKIVTVEQMVDLERRSAEVGAPPEFLMENAGLAVAESARDLLGDIEGRTVVVLVGPGNNGGDGLVAARHLHDWGAKVHLFLAKRKTDADRNFALDMERGIPWVALASEADLQALDERFASADLVMDSLFGTGKVRPLEGLVGGMLERVRAAKAIRRDLKILAVDLPSGLNADTGAVDPATLKADLTVTFACPKVGLFRFPGADYLGQLEIVDIQIPEYLSDHIALELMTGELVAGLLPDRPLDANKGAFGRLLVIAGSINYVGAAYLACEAAMRVGTGLVTLATPRSLYPILAGKLTEVTHIPLPEKGSGEIDGDAVSVLRGRLAGFDAVLMGCGLGQNAATADFVMGLLAEFPNMSLVIDADGLNILAERERWWENLPDGTLLTPHPGEMGRLAVKPVAEIQQERLETATNAAREWGKTVALKGAFTVVASPEGPVRVCGVANPGLASAGTGDVLAGAIGGLMAQGLSSFDAATCGVYLHAMAGELVKAELGDAGMVASDLLLGLPLAIRNIKEEA